MIRFCLATAASIAIAAAQCTPDMTGYPCYHNSGAPIATDLAATAGNPFKGFANNRLWSGESPRTDIESSLEVGPPPPRPAPPRPVRTRLSLACLYRPRVHLHDGWL